MLKIRLKNFRRFLDVDTIDVPQGLTIVTGPNGAGKTTLVESLSYALFGPKKGRGAGGVQSDNAVGEVEVCCTLRVDGHVVKIHRQGSLAELWLDGALQVAAQPGSATAVNRQVSQLLGGLDRDQFEQIYVAEQGQTAGLVAERSANRRETLNVALQLEVLELACSQVRDEREDRRGRVRAMADNAFLAVGLPAEGRHALDEFNRVRNSHKRFEQLDLLVAVAREGLGPLNLNLQEAIRRREDADAVVTSKQQAHDAQVEVVEQAKRQVREHDERYERFNSFREPLAEQEIRQQLAHKTVMKKQGEIDEALACADAAKTREKAQAELETVRDRLSRLPLVKDRWHALVQAQKELQQNIDDIAKLGDPVEALRRATKQQKDAEGLVKSLENDPTSDEREALQRRAAEVGTRENDIRASLAVLVDATQQANCPTCGQALAVHAREQRILHLQGWINEELPRLRYRLQIDQRDLDKQQWDWRSARQEAQDAQRKAMTEITAESARVERLKALQAQQEGLVHKCSMAQHAWDELGETQQWDPVEGSHLKGVEMRLSQDILDLKVKSDRYASLDRLQQELQDALKAAQLATATLIKIREQQAEIGYDADAYRRAHEALESERETLRQLETAIGTARNVLFQRENEVSSAQDALTHAEDALDRLDREADAYRLIEQLLSLLQDFKGHFFTANTSDISRRASHLVAQAVSDGSILGIEFEASGDLFYRDASHARRPISRLSGGEKALVGLCLRIAVAEQALRIARFGKMDFLVLDEVLSSLDDERREAMQRVFDDVQLRGLFDHIIMITHLESVKHGWTANGLRVEKTGPKASRIVTEAPGQVDLDGSTTLSDDDEAEVIRA